jgi:hypothetical protein
VVNDIRDDIRALDVKVDNLASEVLNKLDELRLNMASVVGYAVGIEPAVNEPTKYVPLGFSVRWFFKFLESLPPDLKEAISPYVDAFMNSSKEEPRG